MRNNLLCCTINIYKNTVFFKGWYLQTEASVTKNMSIFSDNMSLYFVLLDCPDASLVILKIFLLNFCFILLVKCALVQPC